MLFFLLTYETFLTSKAWDNMLNKIVYAKTTVVVRKRVGLQSSEVILSGSAPVVS